MKKTERKSENGLIFLCWLVYACSYLGKVNYSANITQIEKYFSVSHAEAGMVSTFFFFAYGIGQIVNGVLSGKYNTRLIVFFSLVISAISNLLVILVPVFSLIKFFWLVNGVALSVLWPCLIGTLGKSLPKSKMGKASNILGTTVATGTVVIYGLSALFAAFDVFKLSFITATVSELAVAIVWFLFYNPFTKRAKEGAEAEEAAEVSASVATAAQGAQKTKPSGGLLLTICFLAIFCMATNLIKDGLTTWVPSILNETFSLPAAFSILITLALPMLAIFANAFAVKLHKKTPDFVLQNGIHFALAGLLTGVVIVCLSKEVFLPTIVGFALVNFFAGASNSLNTSVFPLFMKGKVNSGLMAGVLNGMCYVGSTISSYGFGAIADLWGWMTVFYILLAVCAALVLVAIGYEIGKAVLKRRTKISAE